MPWCTVESTTTTPSSSTWATVSTGSCIPLCMLLSGDWCPMKRAYNAQSIRDTRRWLPVRQRIACNIATMSSRCVRGECPACFATDVYMPVETVSGRVKLRSGRHGDLKVLQTKRHLAVLVSAHAVPTVWNSLPLHLRQSYIRRRKFAYLPFPCIFIWQSLQPPAVCLISSQLLVHPQWSGSKSN